MPDEPPLPPPAQTHRDAMSPPVEPGSDPVEDRTRLFYGLGAGACGALIGLGLGLFNAWIEGLSPLRTLIPIGVLTALGAIAMGGSAAYSPRAFAPAVARFEALINHLTERMS